MVDVAMRVLAIIGAYAVMRWLVVLGVWAQFRREAPCDLCGGPRGDFYYFWRKTTARPMFRFITLRWGLFRIDRVHFCYSCWCRINGEIKQLKLKGE